MNGQGASAAARAPRNKVIVAIANKLARIAWVVLSSGNEYQHAPLAAAVERTRGKALRLESKNAFHFSTATTTTGLKGLLPRSAEEN